MAVSCAAAAQALDPALPLPQFARAEIARAEQRFDDALNAYQEAEKALSGNGQALEGLHRGMGDVLTQLNRAEDAELQYREERRLFPYAAAPDAQ